MTVAEYLARVKQFLVTHPLVVDFLVIKERVTITDGHLRAKLTLTDNSWLEFSEYLQRFSTGRTEIVTYSYHWADATDNLILRWDNTPHFPELSGFPHHIHQDDQTVNPGQPVDIFAVLNEITQRLESNT